LEAIKAIGVLVVEIDGPVVKFAEVVVLV